MATTRAIAGKLLQKILWFLKVKNFYLKELKMFLDVSDEYLAWVNDIEITRF